jgi:hypothetical protein
MIKIAGRILLESITLGIIPLIKRLTSQFVLDEPSDYIRKSKAQAQCPLIKQTQSGKYVCTAYNKLANGKIKDKYNPITQPLVMPADRLEFPSPCTMKSARKCDLYLNYMHSQGFK